MTDSRTGRAVHTTESIYQSSVLHTLSGRCKCHTRIVPPQSQAPKILPHHLICNWSKTSTVECALKSTFPGLQLICSVYLLLSHKAFVHCKVLLHVSRVLKILMAHWKWLQLTHNLQFAARCTVIIKYTTQKTHVQIPARSLNILIHQHLNIQMLTWECRRWDVDTLYHQVRRRSKIYFHWASAGSPVVASVNIIHLQMFQEMW